jgi:predicted ArsR family transcriptional regulator
MASPPSGSDDIARVASLEEPLRRRLYEYVRSREEPVGREEAGEATGIGRSLAAYHLDKLVEQGLLTATYRRPEGRGGPGAGRPAKLYSPDAREVSISVPPREYELAAHLLADAAESVPSEQRSLREVAVRAGREAGAASRSRRSGGAGGKGRADMEAALRERGYEPAEDEAGGIRLRNCPFHRLAQEHRDLICGMNLAFVEGLLEGLERDDHRACPDPRPGQCCVAILPED